jgi:putative transposase
MNANQAIFPVRVMSRLLGVSASGFYAWVRRPVSARAVEDIGLTALIHAIHRRSDGAYGAPSIQAELADDHDRRVGQKRVARLMRAAGLRGLHLRRFVTTTLGDPVADRARDHVDRHFVAEGPDRLWVADITYIPTWTGFLYLAIVLDVWSRRVVGWAMASHLRTELVLDALNMALAQRRPEAVIHHSDRGCQYTSYAFGTRCQEARVMPSVGSTGDAYDNAMAESFFATLEREVLNRRRFQSQAEARMAIFQWLEGWYNPHRRHSALGYLSPINYERKQMLQSA